MRAEIAAFENENVKANKQAFQLCLREQIMYVTSISTLLNLSAELVTFEGEF